MNANKAESPCRTWAEVVGLAVAEGLPVPAEAREAYAPGRPLKPPL